MIRIGHIERFVTDPTASRQFYCEILGFECVVSQPGGFEWVKAGDMEILLRPGTPHASEGYRAGTATVLYADDLESYVKSLSSKGVSLTHADGDECVTFQDPDGHWFQVVCPG